jgi:general secretion pathway protein L
VNVDPSFLLERDISLPASAEQDTDSLLRHEMDRFTSFEAAELFWTYSVTVRDRKRGRLHIRLSFVPRCMVQNTIDILAAAGGSPVALEAFAPDGFRIIPLSRDGVGRRRPRLQARASVTLSTILMLLVASEPFLRQTFSMDYIQSRLQEVALQVNEVDQIEKRIRDANGNAAAIADQRRRVGNVIEALAIVSDLLPDDSYITEFTMRARKITLTGVSGSAPRLIGLFAADSRIANPVFLSAITRQPLVAGSSSNRPNDAERDLFSIQAQLVNR